MIAYRPPATKMIPPPPPEFAENFKKGGWRLIERLYGSNDDRLNKWIAMTGAECRLPRNGRKPAIVTEV